VQKRNEYYLVFDTGATVDVYNLKGKKRKKINFCRLKMGDLERFEPASLLNFTCYK